MQYNLAKHVSRHARERASLPALAGHGRSGAADGRVLDYAELGRRAGSLAALLMRQVPALARGQSPKPMVGILASRSIEACVGVLGCAWAGATYVPISPKTPPERLKTLFGLVELAALVGDAQGLKLLSPELLATSRASLIAGPRPSAALVEAAQQLGRQVVDLAEPSQELPAPPLADVRPDDLAYVMFTSGTTGVPKGVMITAGSASAFLEMIAERLQLRPEDRTLEVTELGFDVSVLNMFATWQAAASLHVLPATKVMMAVNFAREREISVWSSTPSLVALLRQVKVLVPDSLPSVRLAIFIGEPLSKRTVEIWRAAAPGSVIEDLYGPTEATVVCTGQRIERDYVLTPGRDVMSIGRPLPGNAVAIMNAAGEFVPPGQVGELALAGVQLAAGYFGAPDLTARRFPVVAGKRWYLTGDSAYLDEAGLLHHLGRIDNQVKVLGNRVELEEIEAHLRAITKLDLVAVVAWPTIDGVHQGLVGFLCGRERTPDDVIMAALRAHVPAYMLPACLHWIESMPVNANGKTDRRALLARLDEPS